MIHRLKCWSESFEAIRSEAKKCELRRCDDRTFNVKDELILEEWIPEGPRAGRTGRELVAVVTHISAFAGEMVPIGIAPGAGGALARGELRVVNPVRLVALSLELINAPGVR